MKIWKKSLKIAPSLIFLKILALRALAGTAHAAASRVGIFVLCSSIGLAGFSACWGGIIMGISSVRYWIVKEDVTSKAFLAGAAVLTVIVVLLTMRMFIAGLIKISIKISDTFPSTMGTAISKLELAKGRERAIAEARILEEGSYPACGEKIRAKRL